MYDLLTGITMVLVGIVFLGVSIIFYIIEPCIYAKVELIGSVFMIITAFYVVFKTVKA